MEMLMKKYVQVYKLGENKIFSKIDKRNITTVNIKVKYLTIHILKDHLNKVAEIKRKIN